MESLTTYFAILNNLRSLAMKLTTIVPSLTNIFDQEATSLNRQDQISRLRAIQSTISQQLDEEKRSEDVARYSYSKAKLKMSLGQLAVGGIIKLISQDKRKLAFSNYLLQNLAGEQRPFGTVYIGIGPGGFPEDMRVISVSRLARELNRKEFEIIRELQGKGYLLLNEQGFSVLIDKMTEGIQGGRLLLPIATEKLTEIKTSGFNPLQADNSE